MTSRMRARSRTFAMTPSTRVSLSASAGFSRIWCRDGSELSTTMRSLAPNATARSADLRADRAAAAGDEDALAADEGLEPRAVDLDRRAQQQVLDLERGELGVAHALAEARDARQRQAEAARARDERVGMRLGCERAGASRRGAGSRRPALWKSCTTWSRSSKVAEHRDAADRLPEIGRPVRQDALRLDLAHRAGLDRAQDHLDVAGAPEQQGRRVAGALEGVARARVLQVAEREPRAAEQEHLQQPVQRDRDLAEEV